MLFVDCVMVKGKCKKVSMLFVDCVMVKGKCKKVCYCWLCNGQEQV